MLEMMETIRVSDAQDLVGCVPFMLGFQPQDGTVLLLIDSMDDGRRRVSGAMHVEHCNGVEALEAMVCAIPSAPEGVQREVSLVTFARDEDRAIVFGALAWSMCCHADQEPLDGVVVVGPLLRDLNDPSRAWVEREDRRDKFAAFIAAGLAPLSSREALRAEAQPLPRAQEVCQAVQEARAALARREWLADVSAVIQAWTVLLDGDTPVEQIPVETLARAAVGVDRRRGNMEARDALAFALAGGIGDVIMLLGDRLTAKDVEELAVLARPSTTALDRMVLLARHLEGPAVVDALTVLVCGLWGMGESSRASDLLDRMGEDVDDCTLAQLIATAVGMGMPASGLFGHPMPA